LFLTFQRILDHPNQSSYEKIMIKIQTTAQQTRLNTSHTEMHTTRLNTSHTEMHTTRMIHTRKSGQS
jgi:hypothetical protein